MYQLVKFFLFLFPPEQAHFLTVSALKLIARVPFGSNLLRLLFDYENTALDKTIGKLKFKNPIGLAAGFDKNAELIDEMESLGFGFIEVGTITPLSQPGNDKPRLFRLPQDQAIINRMGFNNLGVQEVINNLKKSKRKHILVGGNIGKNKNTPNELAFQDYEICFNQLFEYVDYFVVNVSSPNTPNLRELQEKAPLTAILSRLQTLNKQHEEVKPILLKIAPDLSNEQIQDIIDIIQSTKIAGVIATNTTISRSDLKTSSAKLTKIGPGGLSGQPLEHRATEVIKMLRNSLKTQLIIGVGGIHDYESAQRKLNAGADLIQIYTGLIYKGPGLVKKINRGLANS